MNCDPSPPHLLFNSKITEITHNGLFNLLLSPYLFSLCEPETSCSFIQSLRKKVNPFGHSRSLLSCRRTVSIWYFSWKAGWQILSNGVATSSLLSEHTPSQNSTPLGQRRQYMPTSLPFPSTPMSWEWHRAWGWGGWGTVAVSGGPRSDFVIHPLPSWFIFQVNCQQWFSCIRSVIMHLFKNWLP